MNKKKRQKVATTSGKPRPSHPSVQGQERPLLRSDYIFCFSLAAAIWCANAAWLMLDSRPPVWDMAMHQMYAFNYLPGAGLWSSAQPLWSYSGIYPPFVHISIALAYLVFHPGPQIAVLANIPATPLLLWAVFGHGLDLAGRRAARWAALFTAMIPYLFWMSRETILDYWLSAWVVSSLLLLRRTDAFRKRGASIVLGLLLALGLLTKWLFGAFLFFPILYSCFRASIWKDRSRLLNLGITALISGSLSAIWYVPNFTNLMRYYPQNARIGELEGEPPVLSFQSAIYYIRLLEGYQLFALMFVLVVISLFLAFRRGLIRDGKLLGVTAGGAWLILTLIRTKDPRFSMPLLGLLSIVPGAWIASWKSGWITKAVKILLVSMLCLQAYAINFGVSWLPEELIIAKGYQGSFRWDWNFYLQHYFHILGAPRKEDWKQAEILSRMEQDATKHHLRRTLALVPDMPRFNTTNFMLYARLLGHPCAIDRLILTPTGIYPLGAADYVITAEGEQGMPWTTTANADLNRFIEGTSAFELVDRFPLPEQNLACLYRVKHEKILSR